MHEEGAWFQFVFVMVVTFMISQVLAAEGHIPKLVADAISSVALGLVLLPTILAVVIGTTMLSKWAIKRVMTYA